MIVRGRGNQAYKGTKQEKKTNFLWEVSSGEFKKTSRFNSPADFSSVFGKSGIKITPKK